MLSLWIFTLFNGIAVGMAAFLVAAGLTLIFGLLKLLNFAHGGFFMIGAYVAFTIVSVQPASLAEYILASLAGGIVVALLGVVTDVVVFRRLRDVEQHHMLIATFALLLVCNGAVKSIWGETPVSVSPPPELNTTFIFDGIFVQAYSLFLVGTGVIVFLLLEYLIHWTWAGKLVQAVARDPWMSAGLGVRVTRIRALSVVLSFFLAGLAGGLVLANQSLSPELGDSYLLLAFTAVIIGGLGNIRGAFLACLILGLSESIAFMLVPDYPGLSIYLVLIAFLMIRPRGIFAGDSHL